MNAPAVLLGVAVMLLPLACSEDLTIEREDAPLQTDRLVYGLRETGRHEQIRCYEFDVVVRYTNERPSPTYLDRCEPSSTSPTFGVPPPAWFATIDAK